MKAVLDTNILVDYLVGKEQARKELELYDEAFISVITWMEILAGVDNAREETPIRPVSPTGFSYNTSTTPSPNGP